MAILAIIFKPLTSPLSSRKEKLFPHTYCFTTPYSVVFCSIGLNLNYSNSKKEKWLFVDLITVLYTSHNALQKTGKKSYSKQAGKHDFGAKSINTHHMLNHSQAYFLSPTLPPQVNDNYVYNPQWWSRKLACHELPWYNTTDRVFMETKLPYLPRL